MTAQAKYQRTDQNQDMTSAQPSAQLVLVMGMSMKKEHDFCTSK